LTYRNVVRSAWTFLRCYWRYGKVCLRGTSSTSSFSCHISSRVWWELPTCHTKRCSWFLQDLRQPERVTLLVPETWRWRVVCPRQLFLLLCRYPFRRRVESAW